MSQSEWHRHEATIRRLYLEEGRRLEGPDGVIEIMKTRHSFDKRKSQYEFQFKKWKLSKNKKKSEWEALSHILQVRNAQGLQSEVFYKGKRIPSATVAKEVSRYRPKSTSNNELHCPPGFHIRTPIQRLQETFLTANLPLTLFESSVLGLHRPSQPQDINPGSSTSWVEIFQYGGSSLSDLFGLHPLDHLIPDLSLQRIPSEHVLTDFHRQVIIPRLCSLVPGMLAEIHPLISSPQVDGQLTRFDSSMTHQRDLPNDYIRLLIFLLSNNMLEEEVFSLDKIWGDLRTQVPCWLPIISHLVRQDNPTASVLVRVFFRCAITRGDDDFVRELLRERLVDPFAEEIVYSIKETSYRPLELSLKFGSPAVTSALFNAGFREVDLGNLVTPLPVRGEPTLPGLSPDRDLFFHIVYKGNSWSEVQRTGRLLGIFNAQFGPDTVIRCLDATTAGVLETWYMTESAFEFFRGYNEDQITEVVEILKRNGIQVDRHPDQALVKFLAQGGRNDMAQNTSTRPRGDLMTSDDLLEAVREGRHDFLEEYMSLGGNIFDVTESGLSAVSRDILGTEVYRYRSIYSEAMRCGDTKLTQELESRGVIECLEGEAQWRAAWGAALETDNESALEKMLARVDTIQESSIGVGIVSDALEALRPDIAMLLISNHHISLTDKDATVLFELCAEEYFYSDGDESEGFCEVVKVLLDRGFLIEGLRVTATPIIVQVAVESGNKLLVQKVLAAKGTWRDSQLKGGLEAAVKTGNQAMVALFLDFTSPSNDSLTIAAQDRDSSIAESLLRMGADPLNSDALEAATHSGDMPMVKLLVHHFKVKYPRGMETYGLSALCAAIRENKAEIMDYLVEQKIGIGCRWCGNALFAAIESVDVNAVQKLLRAGLDANLVSVDRGLRETPLLRAIEKHNIPLLQFLVDHGASIAHPATGGLRRTPFQKAVELGNMETIQFFLDHGADINEEPALQYGATALQLAAITGRAGVVHFLLQRDARVNAPGAAFHGRTALEAAAEHGRLETVRLLINAGAGTDQRGAKQVARAMELSQKQGHFEVWKLIRDHFQIEDCSWNPPKSAQDVDKKPIRLQKLSDW